MRCLNAYLNENQPFTIFYRATKTDKIHIPYQTSIKLLDGKGL